MTRLKKLLFCAMIAFILILTPASSNVNAMSYNYDYWKNIIPSAEGISYNDTFYGTDIVDALTEKNNLTFDDLQDMAIYNQKIFILDERTKSDTQIPLANGKIINYTGSSKIFVLNQDFKYEKVIDEFLISDDVKKKLEDYYDFHTPLAEITENQINSGEFVNSYTTTVFTYSGSALFGTSVFYDEAALPLIKASTTRCVVYLNGNKVSYTLGINTNQGGTNKEAILINSEDCQKYCKNGNQLSDLDEVKVDYSISSAVGRSPYVPYSKDPTRAAVRLKQAQGITVNDKGIFIADTNNMRVLHLNFDWEVINIYLTPEDTTFYQVSSGKKLVDMKDTATQFRPTKIAVDEPGRLYAIAQDVYAGIIEYSKNCTFNRFLGKNTVVANPLKKFWAKIFSQEQLSSIALDLPPMFTNITISGNFIYATSYAADNDTTASNMVKAINTTGKDIMTKNGYVKPDGDVVFAISSTKDGVVLGPSNLMGITVSKKTNNFATVDKTRGRIFVYDNEGNLLYIAGNQPGGTSTSGSGTGLSNSIVNPVAISYLYRTLEDGTEEEDILVLDQSSKSLMLYKTTEFGKLVNEATYLYLCGDTRGAETYWREVIKRNTNYELAYLGIGKSLNLQGEYEEAMKYFKLAHSGTYYSKAFEKYRSQVMKKNFSWIMSAVIVVVVGAIAITQTKKIVKKHKQKEQESEE